VIEMPSNSRWRVAPFNWRQLLLQLLVTTLIKTPTEGFGPSLDDDWHQ